MAFCLPKEFADKMLEALKEGRIVPEKLAAMSSAGRRTFFEPIVGKENAAGVNAGFESKLLLVDQKRGLVTWAKQITGIKEAVRTDIISRIGRMEKVLEPQTEQAFLADLAAKKLGTEVTFEEAQTIAQTAKEVQRLKQAIPEDSPNGSAARMDYGTAEQLFADYIELLKRSDPRSLPKQFIAFVKDPAKMIQEIGGITKSLNASMDNSFFARQAIKVLYTHPVIWTKNFLKSWKDIVQSLRGFDALTPIRADVRSRQNSLNGKYEAGRYELGIRSRPLHEEAFPSSKPGKIPIFGRLFRASETAFNGGALRMRADLGDLYIAKMESFGKDPLNPAEAIGIGKLVNSMTGRGSIKLAREGVFSPESVNAAIFSVRFFKSNIDFLTAHLFDPGVSAFAKKQAGINLAKTVATTAGLLWIADKMWPGSVEWSPLSADFGKIKIGNTRFDITGGMSSLIILAARMATGKFKSSTTGKVITLSSRFFNRQTLLGNFFTNKFSPLFGMFRDFAKGQNFQGEEPTLGNSTFKLLAPIPFETFLELRDDPDSADLLMSMILEAIGVSANTYGGQ